MLDDCGGKPASAADWDWLFIDFHGAAQSARPTHTTDQNPITVLFLSNVRLKASIRRCTISRGDGVNVAGGICVSSNVYEEVRGIQYKSAVPFPK